MKSLTPNFRLLISSVLVLGIIYALMPEVQAGGIPYPAPGGVPGASLSSGGNPVGAVTAFAVLLQRIADGAAALAAAVAVLFMVLNGARLTFAFGNTEALGKAKKGLIWASAGLVVIIFAYIITKSVISLTYSGADGSAVIGSGNLAETTTTPGEIDPVNGTFEVGADGETYLAAGERVLTFYQQGAPREFTMYVPNGLRATSIHPAVLLLHGGGGNGSAVAAQTGMSGAADTEKFIAVYPESNGRPWNDGRDTTSSSIDDVAYINSVLNTIGNQWQVDRTKIFVAGISNGGMMTQRLACAAPNNFAGFGVVSANLPEGLENNCNPRDNANMMLISGTQDPIMPYNGGEVASVPALSLGAGGNVLSFPDTAGFWAAKNQCGLAIVTDVSDSTADGTTVEKLVYDAFAQGTLEAFKITGGGHGWPGTTGNSSLMGNTSTDINATTEIINFFKANGLTAAN